MFENRETEFKREANDKVNKALLAFLNTDGGRLYIGIDDDGTVVGVDEPDKIMLKITESFRASVSPDPTAYFKAEPILMEGKRVVKFSVERGAMLPYCFKEYGLVPQGVYVRAAANSVQATREHIRQLIRQSGGDVFLEEVSIEQALTFGYAGKLFAQKGIAFGDGQKATLKIVGKDGRYTNLGLILSDECPYSVKSAIFQGLTKKLFKDRKEFTGSVFKQIDECLAYLNVFNKISSVFDGAYRIDRADYPAVAIREALINAVIHRDYYIDGDILVSLFDDRLEIMSIGGLMPGVTLELMRHGVSISRNDALARVFHRLNLIEAYGTGLPRIFETYGEYGLSPDFPVTKGGVLISMPNINYALGEPPKAQTDEISPCPLKPPRGLEPQGQKPADGAEPAQKISAAESRVLESLAAPFTKKDVALLLKISESGAYKILNRMTQKNLLTAERIGKEFFYAPRVSPVL
jgi:ATP-dependent DNA helicase RecG